MERHAEQSIVHADCFAFKWHSATISTDMQTST